MQVLVNLLKTGYQIGVTGGGFPHVVLLGDYPFQYFSGASYSNIQIIEV